MKRVAGGICLLLVGGLLGGCWMFPSPSDPTPIVISPPELRNVTFNQVDWFEADGTSVQANSLYGLMTWTYDPDSTTTFYLSVSAVLEEGSDAVWIVQNLPLFAVDNGDPSLRREAVYFSFGELGLVFDDPIERVLGIDIQQMYVSIVVTAAPILAPPDTAGDLREVTSISHWSSGTPDESPEDGPFLDPGEPSPVRVPGVSVKINVARDVRAVQEANHKCCAGAFARSLDWLNRKHELGIDASAQRIYELLVAAGVSTPNTDRTPARDEWIAAKDAFARGHTDGRIVTKVWDAGTYVDPIEGVEEETGDFLEWLAGEIGTEDVEVAYYYPGNAHIVTVLEVYVQGTHVYVKYRDDEHQGDNTKGDSAVKHAQIYLKDGKYRFGSDRNIIYFAVSESYVSDGGCDGDTPEDDPPCEGE